MKPYLRQMKTNFGMYDRCEDGPMKNPAMSTFQ
jgi:hypothetical protein